MAPDNRCPGRRREPPRPAEGLQTVRLSGVMRPGSIGFCDRVAPDAVRLSDRRSDGATTRSTASLGNPRRRERPSSRRSAGSGGDVAVSLQRRSRPVSLCRSVSSHGSSPAGSCPAGRVRNGDPNCLI